MGVCGNLCCVAAVVEDRGFSLGVLKYVVCLCSVCDGCYIVRRGAIGARVGSGVFFVMQMFVYCVHPIALLNDAFCMTCSLLMLVEDARGDHMEEPVS